MNQTNNAPSRRKLQLNRETLRELDARESIEVVGGGMYLGGTLSANCGVGTTTCTMQRYSYQNCRTTTL